MEEKETKEVMTDEEITEKDIEESDDTSKTEEPAKEEKQGKTQSREDDAKFAKLRRQIESLQKENKTLASQIEEARFGAKKSAVSQQTLADLGIDKIENDDDLFLCQEYENAKKRGSENPLLEANKAFRKRVIEKEAEIKAQKDEEKKFTEKILAEKENLKKTYGVESSELIKNEEFMSLFGEKALDGNLTEYYGKYIGLINKYKKDNSTSKVQGKLPTSTGKKLSTDILDLEGKDFLKAWDEEYHH